MLLYPSQPIVTPPAPCRLSLTSCCWRLWACTRVSSSAALWGDLAISPQLLQREAPRASLAAWLRRRRGGLRRLRLSFGTGGGAAALGPLLAELEGRPSSPLQALELSSSQPIPDYLAQSLFQPLRSLGALTRLELRGGFLTELPSALSALSSSLAVLDLARNAGLGEGAPEHKLAPLGHLVSLTALDLSGCRLRAVPRCISALSALASLDLNTNSFGQEAEGGAGLGHEARALEPLGQSTGLTRLCLRWTGISTVPPQLSALRRLADLDISRNMLLGGEQGAGNGATSLRPLAYLAGSLTHLDLSYAGLRGLPPQLPRLRALVVLGLSGNLGLGESAAAADGDDGGGGTGGAAAFQALRALPALTRLDLCRCNMPQGLFNLLASLSASGVCVKF